MKKTPLIALTLLAIASCQTRILSRQFHPPQMSPNQVDTVLTLNFADERTLPDPKFLMTTLKCRFSVKDVRVGYDSLVRYAARITRLHGGNVIKVRDARFKFMAFALKVDAFSLPGQTLNAYKSVLDSANNARLAFLANHAIIHLLDRDELGKRSVFLNDSLVSDMKGVGFDGIRKPGRKTLILNRADVLKIISLDPLDPDLTEIPTQLGKEYYIVLYTTLHHRQFKYHHVLTDHDRFVNRNLQYF